MNKLFGHIKMNWLRVIVFAVAAGIYTGAVMLIKPLRGTSFQDIGIAYEWWVIFAVVLVVNCHKGWEAMLKCFVFFLISQPLVYLVQIAAGALEFDKARMYYVHLWLPATILTLPGGLIAYFCKKQNAFGGIVMGLGNTIQACMGVVYAGMVLNRFPYHLLSALVSFVSIFVMTFCIQKKKTGRTLALLLPVVLTLIILAYLKATGRVLY